jgi:hypothetical protein
VAAAWLRAARLRADPASFARHGTALLWQRWAGQVPIGLEVTKPKTSLIPRLAPDWAPARPAARAQANPQARFAAN